MKTKNIRSIAFFLAVSLVLVGIMPLAAMADNPIPSITSLSPTSTAPGSGGFTLIVNGNNFTPGALVNFNGSARSTSYLSSTQLTASILASDVNSAGSFNVTVTNPAPGGGTSNVQVFTVGNQMPSITSISPISMASGSSGFTLTVNGMNFMPNSTVNFNGSVRPTSYFSPTQLTATITSADIQNAGSFNVTVTNPAPGGGTSSAQIFAVTGNNPVATLTSIFPVAVTAGSGNFTLTVYGSNFTPGSIVRFNGLDRATTFVSPNQLTAVILQQDQVFTGSYPVNVFNPVPGGGLSNSTLLTVNPIFTTPGLPNTGFGPSAGISEWGSRVGATMVALLGLSVMAFGTRRAWLTK